MLQGGVLQPLQRQRQNIAFTMPCEARSIALLLFAPYPNDIFSMFFCSLQSLSSYINTAAPTGNEWCIYIFGPFCCSIRAYFINCCHEVKILFVFILLYRFIGSLQHFFHQSFQARLQSYARVLLLNCGMNIDERSLVMLQLQHISSLSYS